MAEAVGKTCLVREAAGAVRCQRIAGDVGAGNGAVWEIAVYR